MLQLLEPKMLIVHYSLISLRIAAMTSALECSICIQLNFFNLKVIYENSCENSFFGIFLFILDDPIHKMQDFSLYNFSSIIYFFHINISYLQCKREKTKKEMQDCTQYCITSKKSSKKPFRFINFDSFLLLSLFNNLFVR